MIRKKEMHTLATLSRYFNGLAGRTTLRSWLSTGRLNTTSTGGEGRLMEFDSQELQKLRMELINERSARLATAFNSGSNQGAGMSDEQLLDGYTNASLSPEQRGTLWPEIGRRMAESVSFRKFMDFHQAQKAEANRHANERFGNYYNVRDGRTERTEKRK